MKACASRFRISVCSAVNVGRLPTLIAAHQAALAGRPGEVILVGKSMGSRVGCHVAVADPARVRALVCFGYPLVGAGKKKPVRDEVLKQLRTPILFIQGTRDPLCPLERLQAVREPMTAPNQLFVVDGGDHSLDVGKRKQAAADAAILAAIGAFVSSLPARTPRTLR